jgi:hypothetical protein
MHYSGIGGAGLIAAIHFTRKPGSATLTALLLWLETIYTMAFVPLAIHIMVSRLGLHYRFPGLPGRTPGFNVTLAFLPLFVVISALIIDGITYWYHRQGKYTLGALSKIWLTGVLIALPALVMPPLILQIVKSIPVLLPLPVGISIFEPDWFSTLLLLPIALFAGMLAAKLGAIFGDFWH